VLSGGCDWEESMTVLTVSELFEKLGAIKIGGSVCRFTRETCEKILPLVNEINSLKKEKKAIILAHSYVSPEILFGVADFVGDSYELSKKAQSTDAEVIVFAAVKFMAETAKLVNPDKDVLIPSAFNGCSLADSISGRDVRALREKYLDYTFVCYINTTADVKAECDVCVTSSNVYKVVEAISNDKIYFLPDKLMGENLVQYCQDHRLDKTIRLWDGTCYVHEEYSPEMVTYLKQEHPGIRVLSHPECSAEVVAQSDFVGSTSQMVEHVKTSDAEAYFMLTECGLTSRIQLEMPKKKFVGTCTMCKYMKSNSLEDILRVLKAPGKADFVEISEDVGGRAVRCIEAMFSYASLS